MSETKFIGSIVAKLPFKEWVTVSLKNLSFMLDRDVSFPALQDNLELCFIGKDLVVRQIVSEDIYDGDMYVSLSKVLEFKQKMEEMFNVGLDYKDISIQAYNWYNCSEEPLKSVVK